MVVMNQIDRFHLASDAINRIPKLHYVAARAKQMLQNKLIDHREYIQQRGEDLPEVANWKWPY